MRKYSRIKYPRNKTTIIRVKLLSYPKVKKKICQQLIRHTAVVRAHSVLNMFVNIRYYYKAFSA